MVSPTSNNIHDHPLPPLPPPPPILSTTNLSISPSSELLELSNRPISRPPSYKLDIHVDLDALEIECQNIIRSQNKIPRWHHQFHGVPLVIWLILFVMVGVVSLFIPHFPPEALVLWLPLVLYFVIVTFVHAVYRCRAQSLQQVQYQLDAIQQRRQRALTQVTEYDNNLCFLHAMSTQHTHPFTTLLPPPPTYQKNQ